MIQQSKSQLGNAFYLLDEKYLRRLFSRKLGWEIFKKGKITKIEIQTHKNLIGSKSFYHIVARYSIYFTKTENEPIHIFCNANSKEPRKGAFEALQYIWNQKFNKGALHCPKPLFFSNRLKAMFYYEMPGDKNLFELISQGKCSFKEITDYVKLTANWLKRLHHLPTKKAKNFNPIQSKIETIIPGPEYFLAKIAQKHKDYPQLKVKIEKLFKEINNLEKKYLPEVKKVIIHGDCHPENVIIAPYGKNSIGIIDYTDTCLGDFTRDIGNFLQQLGWMSREYLPEDKIKQLKRAFLRTYFGKRKLNQNLKNRLLLYQAWTALRSAIFFLTIRDFDIPRANKLMREAKGYLKEIKK
jgi:thiamine kinase-like enzyme